MLEVERRLEYLAQLNEFSSYFDPEGRD
jgi:hypothetical protein